MCYFYMGARVGIEGVGLRKYRNVGLSLGLYGRELDPRTGLDPGSNHRSFNIENIDFEK